ncbi:MAG: AAA family ATPase [Bifidobacteriaceae bacterium]|jgi:GTPase SAR1 family protein|nr:AAA family ATPase [Bifidobacteriaceae bacterium]
MQTTFEINPQIEVALTSFRDTQKHVLITGRAGTGKSTLLRYYLDNFDQGQSVVLAPTGVAALNVEGETIHSFFRIRPGEGLDWVKKEAHKRISSQRGSLYRGLKTIVIDEISMVRADLMDIMDVFLQIIRNDDQPFGGVRLIAFGDLYQLPPVVTPNERALFTDYYRGPYFFNSEVFDRIVHDLDNFIYIELEKIYRQVDPRFINFLNLVRNKQVTETDLAWINQRVVLHDEADKIPVSSITLTATNQTASEINKQHLEALPDRPWIMKAEISGEFPKEYQPTDEILELKIGARVMLLNNDQSGRWVNGSLGTIESIENSDREKTYAMNPEDATSNETDEPILNVRLDNQKLVEVTKFEFEAFYTAYESATKKIARKALGTFYQYPLKLAWAITIHKSQGKTFTDLVIDFEKRLFAGGQAYVALSRARSVDRLWLLRPMRVGDVRLDYRIVRFLTQLQTDISSEKFTLPDKIRILEKAIQMRSVLKMTYLKGDNTKSLRRITPLEIGTMEYNDHFFEGLRAYCHQTNAERTFNLKRILELQEVD